MKKVLPVRRPKAALHAVCPDAVGKRLGEVELRAWVGASRPNAGLKFKNYS